MSPPLDKIFLADLPTQARAFDLPDLATRLDQLFQRCRTAWPGIAADPTSFLQHLARQMRADDSPDRLTSPHVLSVYLTEACLRGDPVAQATLQQLLAKVLGVIRAFGEEQAFVDEVQQQLLVSLLLGGETSGPALAGYAGRGPLEEWLRTAAIRQAIKLRQRHQHEVQLEELLLNELAEESVAPELQMLKARHKKDADEALKDALGVLTRRERTLLRLHLTGHSIDRIATCYRVHRSTTARWLSRARTRLFDELRESLGRRLDLPAQDVRSLLVLLRSQLDASVFKLVD